MYNDSKDQVRSANVGSDDVALAKLLLKVDDDLNLLDCTLTSKGIQQAKALSSRWKDMKVDLIVFSPLRRSIETMIYSGILDAYPSIRAIANHMCTERLEGTCDLGRDPIQLQKDHPSLDFSILPHPWWYHPFEEVSVGDSASYWGRLIQVRPADDPYIELVPYFHDRINKFKQWIQDRPEKNIVVFGHHDFFFQMTAHNVDGEIVGKSLKNAEMISGRIIEDQFIWTE
eukprot:TRINITY_DN11101_c0_g1_i2.p1 TRINITY_DN11101_c0_g1~~TRINITY_DN11101_c0_g1_i2.p1  ORF type:complete len:229 (-),score=50.86 TRINITY_DN11101_c0_g1_i2:123-809(-)